MTDLELSYLAGLFDGEGCIQIAHNKPQYGKKTEQHTLTCKVAMTNGTAVNGFLAFGGSICVKRASRVNPKWKDQYVWSVSSNIAMQFLKIIKPHLRLRKAEADCGVDFQTFRSNKSHRGKRLTQTSIDKREWYREELRRLKDSRYPLRSWYNDERTRTVVAGVR